MKITLKQITYSIIIILFLILSLFSFVIYKKYKTTLKDYEIEVNNNKVYEVENSIIKQKVIVLNLTIEQLNYTNDSISYKLNQARKNLKIKDKEIESLQYYNETFNKVDTIILTQDTIFVKDLKIDTTITEPFYTCKLQLTYPNKVILEPSFINEKLIFVASKKETIKPPKKYWLCRQFQKKHTILTIDVVDTNPYIKTSKSRFINILK